MVNFYDFSPVKKTLTTARSILVALPQRPSHDRVAAALGLFLSLKKMGKRSAVTCPDEMTVDFSSLVGVNEISRKINGKNLLISFDYVEDSIEKVSYHIEEGKFNLVIQPKEGSPPLAADRIDYTYSGAQADLVFVVGSLSLDHLGEVYQKNKELFAEEKVVNLDNNVNNTRFGRINLVNERASSCSELIGGLLSRLSLPIDVDIASNLFYGLEMATRNFSSPRVGAGTFEIAAFCLRAGARRQGGKPPFKAEKKKRVGLEPMPAEVSASRAPTTPEEPAEKPSPDWFEPKIYQGATRV